jgi:hypothetical protein
MAWCFKKYVAHYTWFTTSSHNCRPRSRFLRTCLPMRTRWGNRFFWFELLKTRHCLESPSNHLKEEMGLVETCKSQWLVELKRNPTRPSRGGRTLTRVRV